MTNVSIYGPFHLINLLSILFIFASNIYQVDTEDCISKAWGNFTHPLNKLEKHGYLESNGISLLIIVIYAIKIRRKKRKDIEDLHKSDQTIVTKIENLQTSISQIGSHSPSDILNKIENIQTSINLIDQTESSIF